MNKSIRDSQETSSQDEIYHQKETKEYVNCSWSTVIFLLLTTWKAKHRKNSAPQKTGSNLSKVTPDADLDQSNEL